VYDIRNDQLDFGGDQSRDPGARNFLKVHFIYYCDS